MAANLCTCSSIIILCSLFLSFASCCPPFSFSCGNFFQTIKPPFYTINSSPTCKGLHKISCTGENKTVIQFNSQGYSYVLKNISYTENSILVQDQIIGDPPWGSNCSFLYYPLEHIPIHNLTLDSTILNAEERYFNCDSINLHYSNEFNLQYRQYKPCKDYNLYFVRKLDKEAFEALPETCLPQTPPMFEWKLSYNPQNSNLSLVSAGFSHQLELQSQCFKCQVLGDSCSVNGASSWASACKGDPVAHNKVIIGLTATIGGIFAVCTFIFLFLSRYRNFRNSVFFWKRKKGNALAIENFLRTYGSLAPKRYTYTEVKKITKSFSEKLGQGGYGMVFKGMLPDGRQVAVKLLSKQKGDGQDFINEVSSIGRTSHINIVCLVGFCLEGSQKALIYDFMPNGSLEKYIDPNKTKGLALSWEKLYEIAISVARGLEYLHRGCNTRIVHFDIKPHNILLDENFCPKISDFGLSKLCGTKDSILSMADARGTIGYIAPEVFSRNFGTVSSKSDVYSYGMMVLEMVGGRRNLQASANDSSELYFPHWIYEHLDCNGGLQIWEVTNETEEIVRKMIIVGLWCIQTMPVNRPSIGRVVEMLSGSIKDL